MTTDLKIVSHGIMFPDYFQGTSGVWLNVSLDKHSTYTDIIEDLESEINSVFDHIEYTADLHGFTGDLESQINDELTGIKEHCKDNMSKVFDSSLDFEFTDDDDFQEYPVCIFTIEFYD